MRQPDFSQMLRVLNKQAPVRTTLVEFFMSQNVMERLAGDSPWRRGDQFDAARAHIYGRMNAGYDYVQLGVNAFRFKSVPRAREKTSSLNDGCVITDRRSYDAYVWDSPESCGDEYITFFERELPDGMKWIPSGPGGVLENVITLVGYDNLCVLLYDDPDLVRQIVDHVGETLLAYYKMCVGSPAVGALLSNDDWGFKTQTMLAPQDMRKYIMPWHKKYVDLAHAHGKPAILHSCGFFEEVAEDVIGFVGFDGKHSFEDAILPIEQSYERYKGRLALLGGIDVDFICRSTPQQVAARCRAMVERAGRDGGWALGTGNSIPDYIPFENYKAMIDVAQEA